MEESVTQAPLWFVEDMMIGFLSANADILIAVANTALDASLVPTMLDQHRDRASTIPLTTSVTSTLLWLFTALVYGSISLWIAMVAGVITALLWAIIALQRMMYGDPAERPDWQPRKGARSPH